MRSHRISILGLVLALGGAAGAQTAPPDARMACRPSAMALCHDAAAAGDRAAVRACLIKNFDKVSPDCQAAMKAVQARTMSARPDAATTPKP
jgi:hypothetical protein